MSDPNEPPSEDEPRQPPPMSFLAAAAWAFAITFVAHALQDVTRALRPGSAPDLVSGVGCQAVAYLGGLFLILRVHAPEVSIRDFVALRRTHVLFYPLAILLGAAAWLPATVLADLIEKRWPLPGEGPGEDKLAEIFRAASPSARAGMVLAIAVAGPAIEEVLFRGALFRGLRRTSRLGATIVSTALLFAMVHVFWQVFLPMGLLGLALGFLRARSGSLVPGILLHGAFNGATCAVLSLPRAAGQDSVDVPAAAIAGSLGAVVVLLGLVHLVGARSALAGQAREIDAS
jgi:membrane protease YdiL (CAAX protease family)